MPIAVPAGVTVKTADRAVSVSKGKATLTHTLPAGIDCTVAGSVVTFVRTAEDRRTRALHGLTRALVANAVHGVHAGFTRDLDIVGIGYKAALNGRVLQLALGYSHPVDYPIPEGIEIKVEKQTHLTVQGADRQLVGQVAAEIRSLRAPEPYKGKGIKYSDEVIKKKAGKAGKTGAAAGA
jgi:large subunit ribosomal protein L6